MTNDLFPAPRLQTPSPQTESLCQILSHGHLRFSGFTNVTTVVGFVGELLLIVSSPSVGSFATLQKRTGTSTNIPIRKGSDIKKGGITSQRFPTRVKRGEFSVRSPTVVLVIRTGWYGVQAPSAGAVGKQISDGPILIVPPNARPETRTFTGLTIFLVESTSPVTDNDARRRHDSFGDPGMHSGTPSRCCGRNCI